MCLIYGAQYMDKERFDFDINTVFHGHSLADILGATVLLLPTDERLPTLVQILSLTPSPGSMRAEISARTIPGIHEPVLWVDFDQCHALINGKFKMEYKTLHESNWDPLFL